MRSVQEHEVCAYDQGALESGLHELSQPLTTLAGLLEDAFHLSDTVAAQQAITRARTECDRALEAMRHLHAFAAEGHLSQSETRD